MDAKTVMLTSRIQTHHIGFRLLDYLCARFPYKNQIAWEKDIILGRVVLNDNIATLDQPLKLNDRVSYTSLRKEPPVATNIETIFEDEHIWVVNKPAPLPVHSDGVFIIHTLIQILRTKTENPHLYLGHRLDRETTGVLVLSKNKTVTPRLMSKMEDASSKKMYLAVTRGNVNFDEKFVQGWMGPKEGCKIKKRQVFSETPIEGYKQSATKITLQKQYPNHSLLSCELFTGRTNQIRTHLEAIGFPIAGDKLYGRDDQEYLDFLKHLRGGGDISGGGNWEHPRHLLHAWKLHLHHPITNQLMQFEAPIPKDMKEFLGE